MMEKPPAPSELELTFRAAVLGIVIGILFGAANAYLGLRVGLTVSASIPAAVMSIAFFRALARVGSASPGTLLENNMVQTIGSAGESLAAGVIFTAPALILLGLDPGVLKIFVLGTVGGLLGVLFMIPLRRYLIVREHGNLVFPEGTACASVLAAGQEGGRNGGLVFAGLGLGAVYEFLMSGMELWRTTPSWTWPRFPGAEVSAEASPALVGVGYVIGPRIAAIMFGGGALSWLVFIPAIKMFGSGSGLALYPAPVPVAELDPHAIWNFYLRYLGAGAVVFGGFITLVRSLPVIWSSAAAVLKAAGPGRSRGPVPGPERDLPGWLIVSGVTALFLAMVLLPRSLAPGRFLPSVLAVVFAFFFTAVSSRIVGLIGSSSNPVSGMTIAALLATTLVFKGLGWTGVEDQAAALGVGAIVCIAAAIAGDTSQDLKTGWLVGATPWRQQVGEMVGVLTSAAVIGFVVLRLSRAYGIGSEALPAPQATLMSLVVKGVLSGDLPWTLVMIGIAVAAVVELLGVPSLPFAVGLYLPLSLSTPILLGGAVRWIVEKKAAAAGPDPGAAEGPRAGPEELGDRPGPEQPDADRPGPGRLVREGGVLFASGLIAGSAFLGMALGLLRSAKESPSVKALLTAIQTGPEWAGAGQSRVSLFFLLALGLMLFLAGRGRREAKPGTDRSGPDG